MKSRKALTLLELTVAFVIVAILAAIAQPSLEGAINNEAANTAQLSLSNLTSVAETVALERGQNVPSAADYTTALDGVTPGSPTSSPDPSPLSTIPTSVLSGSEVATSSGQVAIDTTASATGVAMSTTGGGCVMELVTLSKVQSFEPADPLQPCSAAAALSGPLQ